MSLLFETIKIVNNEFVNIEYHNDRVNHSRHSLLKTSEQWDLNNLICIPRLNPGQVYKCRFCYYKEPGKVEFLPYQMKRINSMKLIQNDAILYEYKYLDRKVLDQIKLTHSDVDDVIIVKNGKIADSTYANLVFFDGLRWVTPKYPLLKGTKRQKYIDDGIIEVEDLYAEDIVKFSCARIINAMIDLEECPDIQIGGIHTI